jgi:hypothetical protein
MTCGHDQHSGGHQLMTDMRGQPRVSGTRGDAGRFGEHMIMAIGDLSQLGDGVVEVAAFGGVPYSSADPWCS